MKIISKGYNVRAISLFIITLHIIGSCESLFVKVLLSTPLGLLQIAVALFSISSLKRGLIILLALGNQLMIDQFWKD
jgi:hypothetical protein